MEQAAEDVYGRCRSMKARFGMYWQVYGYQTVDLPDDITTEEEAVDWINDNFEDIPLPDDADYLSDSDGWDEFTIELYKDNINECKSN